jgi:hypothetical protein
VIANGTPANPSSATDRPDLRSDGHSRSLSLRAQAGRCAFSWPTAVTQRDVVGRRNPRSSSRHSRAIAASLAGNAHQLPGDAHQLRGVGGNRGAFSASRSPITKAKNTFDLRAPLRNRTVDLLLTIYPRDDAVANCADAGQVRGGTLCCRPTYLFIESSPGEHHIRQRSYATSPSPGRGCHRLRRS